LLAGNNGDSAVLKSVQIGETFRSGSESRVLFAKNRSYFRSSIARIVQLSSRARHYGHGRRMSVKRLHLFKVIEVIKKELRLVRKLAEREGTTIHERLDDTREKTSHQWSRFFDTKPALRLVPKS
jgi:hypothetical protein